MARLSGTLPALNGSALTNLNASNISSGTVAYARGGYKATISTANPSGGSNGDVWYKYS